MATRFRQHDRSPAWSSVTSQLAAILGPGSVLPGTHPDYVHDATTTRGLSGRADAVVLPETAQQVAEVVAWCYEHDVPIIPRGGGSGYAGGAVPIDGGVVVSLERLTRIRAFDPLLWRIHLEAGVRTGELRRLARENGLFFPPDPGAAEQSQIGGNIATNAGGPHAFKYGVTGHWVTGLEAVLPPGELVSVGGAIRKDQAGYDLKSLLIGSEGTLGIVTAAWLRLHPAPEAVLPVVAFHDGTASGCAAIEQIVGSGLLPAALEYLDGGALGAASAAFPGDVPSGAAFMVIAEADGSHAEAEHLRAELLDVLGENALGLHVPDRPAAVGELWRWRDGVSIAVAARRGGKLGEDIVVPLDRLAEAIEEVVVIGKRHRIEAVSWGHAGDGNLHANFLVDLESPQELARAGQAADEVFALAVRLGGSISGEHGIGWLKRGRLGLQWNPAALAAHSAIKHALDPKGLMNPGKKI
jgi:glycolate oxidase subunit GlcD